MADIDPLPKLKEEATCPICSEIFREPVITDCGHNFCVYCINRIWTQPDVPCPQCQLMPRRRTLLPNRQLTNLVSIVKQMVLERERKLENQLCDFHDDKLCLFCREDEELVCLMCIKSGKHLGHTVVHIDEAAEAYKRALQTQMESLQKEVEDQTEVPTREKQQLKELEEQLKHKRDAIMSEFDTLEEALEVEKNHLMSCLEKQQNNNLHNIREKVAQFSARKITLKDLIKEIDAKFEESDVEFLKDVQSTLTRCKKLNLTESGTGRVEMKTDLENFKEQFKYAKGRFKKLKGTLSRGLDWNSTRPITETVPADLDWRKIRNFACEVTLDPNTAHPMLSVAADQRSFRHDRRGTSFVDDNPERYNAWPCIIGNQMFTTGKHYWEIEVASTYFWRVGICDQSAKRKGKFIMAPYRGFWTIGVWSYRKHRAFTSGRLTHLFPTTTIRVVGVYLDYEAGSVAFYDVEQASLLYVFHPCPFPPILRPFIYSQYSSTPVIIGPVTGQ